HPKKIDRIYRKRMAQSLALADLHRNLRETYGPMILHGGDMNGDIKSDPASQRLLRRARLQVGLDYSKDAISESERMTEYFADISPGDSRGKALIKADELDAILFT